MYRILLIILMLCLLAILPLESTAQGLQLDGNASQASIELELSSTDVEIGVPIEFSFTLPPAYRTEEIEVTINEEQKHLFNILTKPTSDDKQTFKGELLFLTDEVEGILPFKLEGNSDNGESFEIESGAVALTVQQPAFEQADPNDYTKPDNPVFEWQGLVLATIVVALILAILFIIGFFIFKKILQRLSGSNGSRFAPSLSPIDQFHHDMEPVYGKKVLQTTGINAHYTAISVAVRKYLENAYHFQAMEMTDDELEYYVRRKKDQKHINHLSSVFLQASLAKFANFNTTEEDIDKDIKVLREFEIQEKQLQLERAEQAKTRSSAPRTQSAPKEAAS